MTRSELITRLAARFPQFNTHDVDVIVRTLLDTISAQLAQGKRVEIRNFGSFDVRVRRARLSRNPRNGVPVAVPDKPAAYFKAGMELKQRVNSAKESNKKAD